MLKPENKKMLQICLALVAIFTVLVSVVPTGVMVSYAKNDPRNQACYNAGFADGQKNNPYSQTMFNQCGVNGKAYYQGFLSGCISGQGKDYFTCQKLTNAPIGSGSNMANSNATSSSAGSKTTRSSSGGGGGGFGGGGSNGGQGCGGGGFGKFGGGGCGGSNGGGGGGFGSFGSGGGGGSG
ncbi:MAG TPA: hypothetical protein VI278_07475 [Nitrososphaeraceae archaeon]